MSKTTHTPLEEKLGWFLYREGLLRPNQPAFPAARSIIQFLSEEHDLEVEAAIKSYEVT